LVVSPRPAVVSQKKSAHVAPCPRLGAAALGGVMSRGGLK
jgi:hypothetical protein